MARRAGKTARNERLKLQAGTVNAIALSFLGLGFLQPFVAAGLTAEVLVRLILTVIAFVPLHGWAMMILRDIED